MDTSFYSNSWYRVAHLRPRLRGHARIHRQQFRGQIWYVLQDRTSGRFHRFTPAAYLVISLMDGRRTVQQIWDLACSRLGDDVLTQDETIRLLAQLHQADVLHGDVPPDIAEMSQRARKQRRRKLAMSFLNPLAIRLPLIDPDEFLDATMPLARPLLTWFGALLFLVIGGYGLSIVGMHWEELTANITDRVLAAESLLLLLVTYPFVKALHELGHGYAVKKWGGEVHEMGIMFLVFMPVPYVDASAASAFREKWRRVLVGGAGIIVELVLASLAAILWVNVEEGLARAFAFNVMLIGGVSTLLFNGNPLLRFDGYYVLADILEIPNLGNRANRYVGYLLQRRLFGARRAETPATAPREPAWLFSYAIASFCYRVFIVTAIVLFVATKFFVIGVLLAIWSVVMMLGVPLAKHIWFLLTNPVLRGTRGRAFAVCAGAVGAVVAALMFVPLPYATIAEGVVWTPQEAAVHARSGGHVARLYAGPNDRVAEGAPLVQLADPVLDAKVEVLKARAEELRLRLAAVPVNRPAEAKILREQVERAEASLAMFREHQRDLVVRSPGEGRFVLPEPDDVIGRYMRKGQVVGYVADYENPVVQVIVPEDSADLVRNRTRRVEMRFADRMHRVYPAEVERELPAITDRLPSMALSTMGGGDVMMDPTDPENVRALSRNLQLELSFDEPARVETMGGRVYVRFDHGPEPLADRIYRQVRQLFLKRFNV